MKQIGYYARLKGTKELYQFQWAANDEFKIWEPSTVKWVSRNFNEFDIIEVGQITDVIDNNNPYSIFLMAQLGTVHGLFKQDLEYDTHWGDASAYYMNEFLGSEFDDENEPEYDCIEKFIKSKIKKFKLL